MAALSAQIVIHTLIVFLVRLVKSINQWPRDPLIELAPEIGF